jgi:hypothetical protein
MKRFVIAILLFVCVFGIEPKKVIVHAQEDSICADDMGKVRYKENKDYGWDITTVAKTAPPNPIVVGQDKEHRGVDITVDIVSYPGSITYLKEVTCTGFETPQSDMDSCDPYYKEGKYYYWKIICPTENEVYRYIDGTSLMVWLDPTPKTEQWLGWSSNTKGWPLRYMYPEKWSLGTWTPGGFTTVGDNGLWTEEQIKKFEAEHPGYNFLEADPRIGPLPTITMSLANDPMQADPSIPDLRRVLALFGDFTQFRWSGSSPEGKYCHLGSGEYRGSCEISINTPIDGSSSSPQDHGNGMYKESDIQDPNSALFGGADIQDPNSALFGGADVNDPQKALFGGDDFGGILKRNDIYHLALTMKNVPLDLPGEWRIGVEVSVRVAKYDNGTRTEVFTDEYLYRMPKHGYALEKHSFLVYVYISTPCNINEPEGCKN